MPASQRITVGQPASEHLDSSARDFIDEVYKLLDQPLELDAFYTEIITRAAQPLGAANAAVWRAVDSGMPSLVCQTGIEQRTLFRNETTQQQHLRLVADAFRDARSHSVPLVVASAENQNEDGANYVLHLQPVLVDGVVVAAIQLIRSERPGSEGAQQIPWLLMAVAAIAGSFHHLHNVRHKRQATQLMTQFEEFVSAIHASLNPREIAYAIANNGPQLLDCDRILVLLRRGARYRVVAVTGQSTVHPRANAVRSAERLMKALPHIDPVIRYPDSTATFAGREVEDFEAYLDETQAKSVVVCFLTTPSPAGAESSASKGKPSGGFIAEKYEGTLLPGSEVARARILASHSAQAIHNANVHRGIFLLPVWLALGRLAGSLKLHLYKSLFLSLLSIGVVLALIFVRADFELLARGTLQPEQRQHIYARIDGTIDELLVSEGQQVARDQVLARLSNPELDLELEKVVGELRTTNEKLAAVKSSRLVDRTNDRSGATPDRAELAAQEEELRQWIASLVRQQALLEEQRKNLLVRSPLAGKVITWNVDPTLRHRPVRRGQLLMTVAHLEGPWELELFLPDRHAGHFLEAQGKRDRPLDVEFTLATDPTEKIVGQIKKAAMSIQLDEQKAASLLVNAEFDRRSAEFLQPGASVTAKIDCGRRPLGYVWLHDLWDFLQYRILFRF